MTRRMLWTISACVIGLLVLASLAPTLVAGLRTDTTGDAVRSLVEEGGAALRRGPVVVAVAIACLGLLMVGWWWSRRIRQQRSAASDAPAAFASVLNEALDRRRPAAAPSPRHQMVTELARNGQGVAEIARATRLSQDAVRSLIASSADNDRHELPPHPDAGGGRT